jgi:homoserine O-acetyltransferase
VTIDPGLFRENERTAPGGTNQLVTVGPWKSVPDVTIAYQTWGTFTGDNAVLVCHALTSDANCVQWWERLVGPGRPIDTDRYFVVCSNVIGGCQGTTGPASIHPDGQPWGSRFPVVTVADMVEMQARLADALQIPEWQLVAGGSMGGMQALEWAARFPNRVKRVFCSASAAAHSAMQIGFNETARQAILRDPKFRGGDYPPNDPPTQGLAVARMVGHLSFLSGAALEHKFGRRWQPDTEDLFAVESYLNYQGAKFTHRFDANSLLRVTRAIDHWEWTPEHVDGIEFLFVSFTSDTLYPPAQSDRLAEIACDAGGNAKHVSVDLPYGHDAFLLDGELQGRAVREFLAA